MKAGISVIRRIKKTDNNRIARYFSYFVDEVNVLEEVGFVTNAWMQTKILTCLKFILMLIVNVQKNLLVGRKV